MLARARQLKNDEGFTLIELLIVIVILGVLSAVVVFSVSGISNKGTAAACAADKSTIATAAEAFYATSATSKYPVSLAELKGKFINKDTVLAAGTTVTFDATGAAAPTVACGTSS